MQTFLPYASFTRSAKVLDRARLGKQRVEAKQILQNITGESSGWRHHPAVLMWWNYSSALALYGIVMCVEWKLRGFEDNLLEWFVEHYDPHTHAKPDWLGDLRLHLSHKRALVYKNHVYYHRIFHVKPKLDYYWPVTKDHNET